MADEEAVSAATGADVSLGGILAGTLSALRTNAFAALSVSLVLSAVPGAAWGFQYGWVLAGGYGPLGRGASILLLMIVGLLAFAVSMLAEGALIHIGAAHRAGRRAPLGDALETGLRAMLPMMGRAILATVAIGLAALALLVPAVLLYVVWAVAAPALVIERLGVTDALERSQALTRGARWRVFGLQLVLLVVAGGLDAVEKIFVRAAGIDGQTPAAIAPAVVVATFVTAFSAIARTLLYCELRDWKEGPPTDRLADIFA